jgi:hypothetical protein
VEKLINRTVPFTLVRLAELHWYEGHGKGRKETKIKKYLE